MNKLRPEDVEAMGFPNPMPAADPEQQRKLKELEAQMNQLVTQAKLARSGEAPPNAVSMRRFILVRSVDVTGISGTGVILYGVEWLPGGPVDVYWLGTKTTGQYPSMDVVRSTHCYHNNARVVYIDGEAEQEASEISEGMTLTRFAKTWLEQAGLFDTDADYDGALGQSIFEIITLLASQGHTGASAAATFSALCNIYEAYEDGESPIWQAYWASDEGKKLKAQFEGKERA